MKVKATLALAILTAGSVASLVATAAGMPGAALILGAWCLPVAARLTHGSGS